MIGGWNCECQPWQVMPLRCQKCNAVVVVDVAVQPTAGTGSNSMAEAVGKSTYLHTVRYKVLGLSAH